MGPKGIFFLATIKSNFFTNNMISFHSIVLQPFFVCLLRLRSQLSHKKDKLKKKEEKMVKKQKKKEERLQQWLESSRTHMDFTTQVKHMAVYVVFINL
jgi:mannitol-specific phosphotransferase system IIBC component